MNFNDLNENVIFICETLNYVEKKFNIKLHNLERKDPEYNTIKNLIDLSIKICIKASAEESFFLQRQIKLEIFAYLLKRYFNLKTTFDSNALCFYLLVDCMIENQFEDLQEVILKRLVFNK